MPSERRNTHLLRVLGAGLVGTVCGWALYVNPRPRPPEPGFAEASLEAQHEAYLKGRTAALLQGEHWQEAEPLASELLASHPEDPALLRQDAELEARLGHDPETVALWERFRKAAPGSAAFCPPLGDACLRLGRREAAFEAYRQGLALEPRNPQFHLALARAYEQEHQFEQAAESYQRACDLDALLEPARLGLARTQHRLGDPGAALDNLTRVLRHAPDDVEAILLQGLLLRKAGRYRQARLTLERGLAAAPNDKNIMLGLARVAEAEGRFKVAVTWLERVLAQFQEEPEAKVEPAKGRPAAPPTPRPAGQALRRAATGSTPDASAAALTGLQTSDLPRLLALGASRLQAMPADHWTLRLEVAFQPGTLRHSASVFRPRVPDLYLLPITARSGAAGYQLLLGDFSSKAAAEEAIGSLPGRFRTHGQRPLPFQARLLQAGVTR